MKNIWPVVLALAGGLLIREVWPKMVTPVAPAPQIVTKWDTVTKVDTLWKVKVREHTNLDTVWAESVTISKPDTVTVRDTVYAYTGIDFVLAGKSRGDSVLVSGLRIKADGTSVVREVWTVRYWQGGPLKSLDAGSFPPVVNFWPVVPQPKQCSLLCKAKLAAIAGVIGYAAGKLP